MVSGRVARLRARVRGPPAAGARRRGYCLAMEAAWIARARWRWRGAWLWPTFVVAALLDGVIATRPAVRGRSPELRRRGARRAWCSTCSPCCSARARSACCCAAGAATCRWAWPATTAGRSRSRSSAPGCWPSGSRATRGSSPTSGRCATPSSAPSPTSATTRRRRSAPTRSGPTRSRSRPGAIYRTCVPSQDGRRSYCVIVKPRLPLARSVVFAGYEPNWLFAEGVN